MPYRYNGKRSVTVWIDEEFLYHAVDVAERLGFESFSKFVNAVLREAVAAAELAEQLGVEKREAKRKFVLSYVFSKIKTLIS